LDCDVDALFVEQIVALCDKGADCVTSDKGEWIVRYEGKIYVFFYTENDD
jgi:hypothetical protein